MAAAVLVLVSWLPWGHMHFDPAATLDTGLVSDQRQWFGNQGVACGLLVGGRELD